jgi:hypothetical protein
LQGLAHVMIRDGAICTEQNVYDKEEHSSNSITMVLQIQTSYGYMYGAETIDVTRSTIQWRYQMPGDGSEKVVNHDDREGGMTKGTRCVRVVTSV